MNKPILNIVIQDFILNYIDTTSKLAFAGSPFPNVSVPELIQQIESRRKIREKLPTWYNARSVYYPPKLNLEQTSSELTAKYKASIISGDTLADITGGFGVDSFYFSEKIKQVDHFEINERLSIITAHNYKVFQKKNVQCFATNGLEMVLKKRYSVIYADPSRRHNSKGKVYLLGECEPHIPNNLEILLNQCDILMLKTSPMLDISAGLTELNYVYQIHIVAVNNEVKELIWLLQKDANNLPEVYTINFKAHTSETFNFRWNTRSYTNYSNPLKYLYEPNASILKSGAFDLLSEVFGVNKLHKHTHLYTSNSLKEFPGRRFIVEDVVPYTKAAIRESIISKTANITTRNFPESVAILRKKWKIKDGGNQYLFFTTVENQKKVVLICTKVK